MRTGTLEKIVARGPTNAPLHIMVRSKYAVLMPHWGRRKKKLFILANLSIKHVISIEDCIFHNENAPKRILKKLSVTKLFIIQQVFWFAGD